MNNMENFYLQQEELLEKLQLCMMIEDSSKRSIDIFTILTEALELVGLKPILVGGRAVEFYTSGMWATADTDIVLDGRHIANEVFLALGFEKRGGDKNWYNKNLNYLLEIPDNVLEGDMEKVNKILIDNRHIYTIGFEDLILDRLRACEHWRSTRDCEQAEHLLTVHFESIDMEYMVNMSKKERMDQKLDELLVSVKQNRSKLGLET